MSAPAARPRLGLVLLPDAPLHGDCLALSTELTRGRRGVVTLGPRRLPHLTLLHVDTDRPPEQLWAEAEAALPADLPIAPLALALLPYRANGAAATMAWLIVPCAPALREAERAALALPSVQAGTVATRNGDAFQPHFTVAIWEGDAPAEIAAPRELLARGDARGRLALGPIGPNGTFQEVLFERAAP